MGYYAIMNSYLRTGDCYFMRDDGAISWTARLSQAGPKYANSIDVVPTHSGLFMKSDPVYFYNGDTVIIELWGSEIRQHSLTSLLGNANNCPGFMQVRRPSFMNTPCKFGGSCLTPVAGLTSGVLMINGHDLLYKNAIASLGKAQYDWCYVVSAAVQMLGIMRGNFIQVLVTEALKRLNVNGTMLCSEFVLETYAAIMAMYMNYGWYLTPPERSQMVSYGAVGAILNAPVGMPGIDARTMYPHIMNIGTTNPVATKYTPYYLKKYLYGVNICSIRPGTGIYDGYFWTYYP